MPCTDADGGDVAPYYANLSLFYYPSEYRGVHNSYLSQTGLPKKEISNFSAKKTKPCTLPFTNLTEQKLLPVLLFWPLTIFNDIMWHKEKVKREGPPDLQ